MNGEKIRGLIEELDSFVPTEDKAVRLVLLDEHESNVLVEGTRAGYIRLGVELVKAAVAGEEPAPGGASFLRVDVAPMLADDSDLSLDTFLLVDEIGQRGETKTETPDIVIIPIIAALVAVLALVVVGGITVIKWIF